MNRERVRAGVEPDAVLLIPRDGGEGNPAARVTRAVYWLWSRGIYPGPSAVNMRVHGHSRRNLNGKDTKVRNAAMKALGIRRQRCYTAPFWDEPDYLAAPKRGRRVPELHPLLPDPAAPVRAGETVDTSARADDDIGSLKSGQRSAGRERQHPGPNGTRRGAAQSLSESTVYTEGLPAAESVPAAEPGLAPVSPDTRAAGGAPPAGSYERLTCADLADLGIEGFRAHEPANQTADDPHCGCWQDPPLAYECGSWFGPSALDVQACRHPHRLVLEGYVLDLCCSCEPEVGWAELGREIEGRMAEVRA